MIVRQISQLLGVYLKRQILNLWIVVVLVDLMILNPCALIMMVYLALMYLMMSSIYEGRLLKSKVYSNYCLSGSCSISEIAYGQQSSLGSTIVKLVSILTCYYLIIVYTVVVFVVKVVLSVTIVVVFDVVVEVYDCEVVVLVVSVVVFVVVVS